MLSSQYFIVETSCILENKTTDSSSIYFSRHHEMCLKSIG